jgi:hypothetical protein
MSRALWLLLRSCWLCWRWSLWRRFASTSVIGQDVCHAGAAASNSNLIRARTSAERVLMPINDAAHGIECSSREVCRK